MHQYPMARTKANEAIKKRDLSMQPPRKQIKLGNNHANAIATPPNSPHPNGMEHPRGEDDWALVTFVGEQIQDIDQYREAMKKVNTEPCVMMDTPTLDLLNIREDVTWYLRKLGLSKLFNIRCSEYPQLTNEFLSTVALTFPNNNGDQLAGEGLLLFKIGDQTGRLSIAVLCKLIGLPNETAHDSKGNSNSRIADFSNWTHFANEPFVPSRSKVSRITHPAVRYVHRLLSSTFQCKLETNKVTTDEFYILTTPFIKNQHHANLGLLFAKTLITVRRLAQNFNSNKKLCVRFGRLITAIVQHVGIDITNYEPLPKAAPLDLHVLQQIHSLNRWMQNPTKFCYEYPIGLVDTTLVLLPYDDLPSLRTCIVTFQPLEEDFYVPSKERPALLINNYYTSSA